MVEIPNIPYQAERRENLIARMLSAVSDDWDKSEGGFLYDAISPAALELENGYQRLGELLTQGFVAWSSGTYLDMKAAERGVYRMPATAATGSVRLTGTPGTVIPGGSRFTTEVDAASEEDPVAFKTDAYAQIPESGVVDIPATCTDTGEAGNVQAGKVVVNAARIRGIAEVINPAPFSGGREVESDEAFRTRFLDLAKTPSSGGNIVDYLSWAYQASPLVGRVKIRPVWDGNGTVQVLLADSGLAPADAELVRKVQDFIDPGYVATVEDTAMTPGGYGVTADATQSDSTGSSAWNMVYDAAGPGTVSLSLTSLLQASPAFRKDGIYQVGLRIKADRVDGAGDLLRLEVVDAATGLPMPQERSGAGEATAIRQGPTLTIGYAQVYLPFFWDGETDIQLKVSRLLTDPLTTLWVDSVEVTSLFGMMQGAGRAPIGAQVGVMEPKAQPIDIRMGLVIQPGYDLDDIREKVEAAIFDYIRGLALSANPHVLMGRVSNAVFSVAGVEDCQGLVIRVGGGAWQSTNITIADDAMAVPGTVEWT